jgi:hypothetical protein
VPAPAESLAPATVSFDDLTGRFRLATENAVIDAKEIEMAFWSTKDKAVEAEEGERSGGWYADPFGKSARRWYDDRSGWSDRVEGEGETPDKTGLARLDEAAVAPEHADRSVDADGKLEPLSRPVDAKYMADARPVR